MNTKLKVVTALLVAISWSHPVFADFYVSPTGNDINPGTLASPFKTIDKARLAARTARTGMTSDITIYLRGGNYTVPSTLTFDGNDSGLNGHNIVYKSYGSEKPVVSAGLPITGWTAVGGGVYRAPVPAGVRFRQLYINGKRAIRARMPNVGSYNALTMWVGPNYPATGLPDGLDRHININPCDFGPSCAAPAWKNLTKIELVTSNEWMQRNLRLASLNVQSGVGRLYFQQIDTKKGWRAANCHTRLPNDQPGCSNNGYKGKYYFENAREFLDQTGEFYLDETARTVEYLPRSGENMATASAIVPSSLESVVKIAGASNLQFKGITFEHSNWMSPSDNAFATGQGDTDGGMRTPIPGAFHMEYANNILLERNTIRNTGSAGIRIFKGSRNISIIGNVVKETAAGGIDVAVAVANSVAGDVVRNVTVRNNYIVGIGRDYYSGQGVQAHFVSPIYIDHNEVEDVGYTGIGINWVDTGDTATSAIMEITNNRVSNVMNKLSDGAGIYTYETIKPATKISGNFVSNVHRSAFGGAFAIAALYLDQKTSNTNVSNNVLRDSDKIIFRNVNGPNNIIGTNPLSDATIEANAGLQAAYKDIKTGGTPIPTDTTVPSIPLNLNGTAASSSQVNLTWSASTDNAGGSGVGGYKVYSNGLPVATVTGTAHNVTGLAASTSYNFTVASFDNAGNNSAQSAIKAVKTLAGGVTTGFPVTLRGAVLPESRSVTLAVTKPAGAVNATITLSAFDADSAVEGVLSINGACPTTLFGTQGVAANNDLVKSIVYTVSASCFVNGNNTLLFTHTATAGYRVDAASVTFSGTTPPPVLVPPTILSPTNNAVVTNNLNKVTISWGAVSGATGYAVRMVDNQDGTIRDSRNSSGCAYLCIDNYQGTSITMDVRTGHTYRFWIHSRAGTGAYPGPSWSGSTTTNFSYTFQ